MEIIQEKQRWLFGGDVEYKGTHLVEQTGPLGLRLQRRIGGDVTDSFGQLRGEFVVAAGNFRMTEMAAALGLAQLQRLDDIVARRREIAALYREALGQELDLQNTPTGAESNYQTFGIILPQGRDRNAVREKLHERGVEAGLLSFAIHKLGSFAGSDASMPIAEHVAARGLALPLYPQMRNAEAEEVAVTLSGVLNG